MSSMSYQSPDASKELKKGNIASFFKPGGSAKAGKPVTEGAAAPTKLVASHKTPEAVAFANRSTLAIKSEDGDGQQAQLASDAKPTGLNADNSDISLAHAAQTATPVAAQHSKGPSACVQAECEAADQQTQGCGQKKDGDILNTDDAGGIGERIRVLWLQDTKGSAGYAATGTGD